MDGADLESLDWHELGRAVTAYAHRRLGRAGSIQQAEDVAARAVETLCTRVLRGDLPDLPSVRPVVVAWLRKAVDYHLKNGTRTKSLALVAVFEDEVGVEAVVDDAVPDPEEHLLLVRRSAAVMDAMLDRVSKDGLAGDVFLLTTDGVRAAADQAAHLHLPVRDIYKARRRLDGHYRAVIEQLKDEVEHG